MNNKLIQKLIREASISPSSNGTYTFYDDVSTSELESLIKLVLDEVDMLSNELYHNTTVEMRTVLLDFDKKIKEHFYLTPERESQ